MTSSIASLGASPCYSLLLKQLIPSQSCLERVRGSHVSFLHSVGLQQASRFRNGVFERLDDSQKSVGAVGCVSSQMADVARSEGHGRRVSGRLESVVCHASRASSAAEPTINVEDFVEIGTIAETHGIYGELRVRSLTDFPQERFETPGTRWIKRILMGRPSITQVELVEGREIIGKQSSWLVTLEGFDTPEKASELQGATMLVRADDRPASLGEEEDYIPDLVGMDVIIEETKEKIGTIVDIHNSGASDLLRVQLTASKRGKDVLIWIPFVKDIVPVVDIEAKRVEIRPPEGLLDLNVPSEGLTRKEMRKEERKRKAIFSAIRKRLTALGQAHVLDGLTTGDETQRQALMDQLMTIDFGRLQQALQHAFGLLSSDSVAGELQPPPTIPQANWADFESWTNTKKYKKRPANSDNDTARWWFKGLQLVADGEVAVVVLAGGQATRLGPGGPPVKGMLELNLPEAKSLFEIQAERLLLVQELASQVYPEAAPQIPWIVLTSDATDAPTRAFFDEKEYFGLDESQVWFVKQDSLPCVDLEEGHNILLESPWKLAVAPTGNGGLFSALHAQNIVDRLSEEGVRYVQVYSVDNALVRVGDPVFFGYAHEKEADVGVKVVKRNSPDEAVGVVCLHKDSEENPTHEDLDTSSEDDSESDDTDMTRESSTSSYYGVLEYNEMTDTLRTAKEGDDLVYRAAHICVNLFSVDYLMKLANPKLELGFHTALKRIPFMKEDESGEWATHVPDQPNGIKLEQFIFDAFKHCDPEKVALLEVNRNEEFAPIKNASGEGIPDTAETARDMLLALQNRLSSTSPEAGQDGETNSSLLRAYICGI
ncbi:hypothetical protein KC19_7G149500 [Ceratodon purpureus]|uniref:Uncharacterized protein n=1 Tax=Ceratodon purpureus TaxID=3225 RepID=A0A8T0HAD9_CERPU|nr:hypothetical protein KC19_7G149500 [Ceratodon purpureus]